MFALGRGQAVYLPFDLLNVAWSHLCICYNANVQSRVRGGSGGLAALRQLLGSKMADERLSRLPPRRSVTYPECPWRSKSRRSLELHRYELQVFDDAFKRGSSGPSVGHSQHGGGVEGG